MSAGWFTENQYLSIVIKDEFRSELDQGLTDEFRQSQFVRALIVHSWYATRREQN